MCVKILVEVMVLYKTSDVMMCDAIFHDLASYTYGMGCSECSNGDVFLSHVVHNNI